METSGAGWRLTAVCAVFVAACSGDGGDGANGGNSEADVLGLIQRNNDATRDNHSLYCDRCACGQFLDVSDAAEHCQAEVMGDFPELRDVFVQALQCLLGKSNRRRACLEAASDCAAAEACSDRESGADCEAIGAPHAADIAAFAREVEERCGRK
jgi:hypothetical protein